MLKMDWRKVNVMTVAGAGLTMLAAFMPALPEKWRMPLAGVMTLATHFMAAKTVPLKVVEGDKPPLGLDN